jgi:3'-phosphoadenosine 5'-phosphosulfate sulfotransferase (PAPS reductase)/FAD synthetase
VQADLARASIAAAIHRHGRASLLFSGGKESCVLADLAEPFRDCVELVYVNTGAMLPHMVDHVRSYGERFTLVELHSDQGARFRAHGPPTRILPLFHHRSGLSRWPEPRERLMLSDPVSCCYELRMQPIEQYISTARVSLVMYGQRRADNVLSSLSCSEVLAPLWNWSTDNVLTYAHERGLALPEQYAAGAMGSFDCWNCTERADPDYLRWLEDRHPNLHQQLAAMLTTVYSTIPIEYEKIRASLNRSNTR